MGKRLCFAALALLIPAAVQAQGLESLLSSMEEANEEKLNPVAEHPPLTAPPFLAPVALATAPVSFGLQSTPAAAPKTATAAPRSTQLMRGRPMRSN